MAPANILIVGCGIAGPALASFLLLADGPASSKPRITILERSPSVRSQGQNIDIRGAGVLLIKKLGLESAIRSGTTGELGVEWVDSQSKVWAAIPAGDSSTFHSPTSDIEILRGRLGKLLYERSVTLSEENKEQGGTGIEYVFGDYVDEIEEDGDAVRCHFVKAGDRRFDIVVGADGLTSKTRRLVFGDCVHKLGAYSGFFSMPRTDYDTDWRRWFHAPGIGCMIRPSDDKSKSTVSVWVHKEDHRLDEAIGKDASVQKKLLRGYFEGSGWQMERVLKEMDAAEDFYYSEIAMVKTERYYKGRVVLLADAGYCASPISGMGTTLALTGAYHLAAALQTGNLDQYEQAMKPVVMKAQTKPPRILPLLMPQTAWGLSTIHYLAWLVIASGVGNLIAAAIAPFAKPPEKVELEDYGFKSVPDGWRMSE